MIEKTKAEQEYDDSVPDRLVLFFFSMIMIPLLYFYSDGNIWILLSLFPITRLIWLLRPVIIIKKMFGVGVKK